MMTDILFNSLFDTTTCADCSAVTSALLYCSQSTRHCSRRPPPPPLTTAFTTDTALDIFIPEWCPQFGTAASCLPYCLFSVAVSRVFYLGQSEMDFYKVVL